MTPASDVSSIRLTPGTNATFSEATPERRSSSRIACSSSGGVGRGCHALLLIPTTAMTGNYRVTSYPGWSAENVPAYMGVTATQDGTTVKVPLKPSTLTA